VDCAVPPQGMAGVLQGMVGGTAGHSALRAWGAGLTSVLFSEGVGLPVFVAGTMQASASLPLSSLLCLPARLPACRLTFCSPCCCCQP
jgi:hypothetical protein